LLLLLLLELLLLNLVLLCYVLPLLLCIPIVVLCRRAAATPNVQLADVDARRRGAA
jgi:hypothetical protein